MTSSLTMKTMNSPAKYFGVEMFGAKKSLRKNCPRAKTYLRQNVLMPQHSRAR